MASIGRWYTELFGTRTAHRASDRTEHQANRLAASTIKQRSQRSRLDSRKERSFRRRFTYESVYHRMVRTPAGRASGAVVGNEQQRQLEPVGDAKLTKDFGEMRLDGPFAYVELPRNLLVRTAASHQSGDLMLAYRKTG